MTVVFITGAGYIGNALAFELRRRGYEVYVLARSAEKAKKLVLGEVKPVLGDVLKLDTYESIIQKADVIVHTATITDFAADGSFDVTSFNNFKNVIEKSNAAGNPKKRFIFTSGGLVYDPSNPVLTEDSPTSKVPIPLLQSRIKMEQDVIAYADAVSTVIRPPFVYGGENGHYTTYFKQADDGNVKIEGDGSNFLPNVHINDIVQGYIKVIEADPKVVGGQIFHFSEDAQSTFLDIATAFAKAAGYKGKFEFGPFTFPLFDAKIAYDNTKAKTHLGWKTSRTRITDEAEVLYASWKAGGYPALF